MQRTALRATFFSPTKRGFERHSAVMTESAQTIVVTHPLVQHKLTLMRRKETTVAEFRRLLKEISMLLAYEATRDLSVTHVEIDTPVQKMTNAPVLDGKKLVLVGILRAGLGILDGMIEIVPAARVGHIGMYRNHETLEPVEYFFKVPGKLQDRTVIVCDPMLATGNSAVAAVDRLKRNKPGAMKFVCLLACPEGLKTFHDAHPDVPVVTAAVDEKLNEKGYIIPGLGDAGDRLFGTR
jgi:uracil phosphoribosyltransferase